MSRSRLASALSLLVGMSWSVVGSGGVSEGATSAANGPCTASHLVVTWRGTTGGLAGHFGDLFWVRNEGSAACEFTGYPTVDVETSTYRVALRDVDNKGREWGPMGIPGRTPLPEVRLAPRGGIASFWVFGEDVMPPCPDLPWLVVRLPGMGQRFVLPTPEGYQWWPYCGTEVYVLPLLPGDSGSVPQFTLKYLETS